MRRRKKMENAYCLICILILPYIRSTEGTPMGITEKLKTDGNLGENQGVTSSWQKSILLEPKNISVLIGEDVTLVVDRIIKSEIQDVQWVKNGVNFATTKPNSGVTIRDNRYDGRLSSSGDGSLVIHEFAVEDQGEYKADILLLSLKKYEIVYSLHISEERDSHRTHVTVVVSVILVLVVVAAALAFGWWKRKICFGNTRRNQARGDLVDKSMPEKEKLQHRGSSPSPPDPHHDETKDVEDKFYDAVEAQRILDICFQRREENPHHDETKDVEDKFYDAVEAQRILDICFQRREESKPLTDSSGGGLSPAETKDQAF